MKNTWHRRLIKGTCVFSFLCKPINEEGNENADYGNSGAGEISGNRKGIWKY